MTTPDSTGAATSQDIPVAAVPSRPTLTDHLLRQPSLIVTLAYAITALVGVWGSYWYYRRLGVPILEFLQIGDFFAAGLRDPAYGVFAVIALIFSWATNIPYGWRDSQPERYVRMRRYWWFRMSYVEMPAWTGAHRWPPGTGVMLGVVWIMLWAVFSYAQTKAMKIRDGQGIRIAIDESVGASDTRLLGTTSAWVFVWHIDRGEAEALPIEAISRLGLTAPAVSIRSAKTPPPTDVATPPAASETP